MVLVPHLNRIGNLVLLKFFKNQIMVLVSFLKNLGPIFGFNSTYNRMREPNYGSNLLNFLKFQL